MVDGNVERVLLRVTGRAEDATAKGRAFVRAQAGALIPRKRLTDDGNAAGDHNQAMMELGAVICLPKGPLCLQCPVYSLCRTKGEHGTVARGRQRIQRVAYLLATRDGEVLLERRAADASLMAGMMELPGIGLEAVEGMEPVLRVRHSITNTNYLVEVFEGDDLRASLPVDERMLEWVLGGRLREMALTGLARKVLMRVGIMVRTRTA